LLSGVVIGGFTRGAAVTRGVVGWVKTGPAGGGLPLFSGNLYRTGGLPAAPGDGVVYESFLIELAPDCGGGGLRI